MSKALENAKKLYLEGIQDGDYENAMQRYAGAHYRQHSTGVKDGKDGFIAFFKDFTYRYPKRNFEILHALEEGDLVFLHVHQNLNGGEAQWVTMDFWQTDQNDKLIEHWDVISAFRSETPAGGSSIDGSRELIDNGNSTGNKDLVTRFIRDMLMRVPSATKADVFLAPDFLSHSMSFPHNLSSFKTWASEPNRSLFYLRIHLIVAQANFVATLSHTLEKKENRSYARMDLFRLENEQIAEHWETTEPIPAAPVNSGKF